MGCCPPLFRVDVSPGFPLVLCLSVCVDFGQIIDRRAPPPASFGLKILDLYIQKKPINEGTFRLARVYLSTFRERLS